MNYKGNECYTTYTGAFLTLITFVITFATVYI
jgi:hypothetical protein